MVYILLRATRTRDLNMMLMQKPIVILVLVWLNSLWGAHAQAPAPAPTPACLNKLRLSGVSGAGAYRLALINNQSFSEGEVNELKMAGQTVKLKCLEIGQETVVVQIQDTATRYELIMSGAAIPLGPPLETALPQPVVPAQPQISTPPSPKPLGSSLPAAPPKAFSFTPLMFGGGICLALLLGLALGAIVRRRRVAGGS